MIIRILNEKGIDEFRKQLQEIRIGARQELNTDFLINKDFTTCFENDVEIEEMPFKNKQEIIEYLCEKIDLKNHKHLYYHRGLWTWLAAFYFKSLTSTKDGKRKVNEDAKYILMEPKNWRRYYRHLLASFARVYCELDVLAIPYLSYPISIWSDLHEQLFAYQRIATNRPLIEAANKLYWDNKNLKIKKGAGSSGSGTPRRFSAIVGQFELTFDLNAMNYNDILSLFPQQEFKKWESAA
ncbi:MAG: hypothetical protein J0H55_05195 [Chitinophagaceae bacterium]|nr:hypothetical protein [Chitinophagaceae bacterium]